MVDPEWTWTGGQSDGFVLDDEQEVARRSGKRGKRRDGKSSGRVEAEDEKQSDNWPADALFKPQRTFLGWLGRVSDERSATKTTDYGHVLPRSKPADAQGRTHIALRHTHAAQRLKQLVLLLLVLLKKSSAATQSLAFLPSRLV
jgi:hypothetical protein